jgi:hypothetical protein
MFDRRPFVRRAVAGDTAVLAMGALALGGVPAAGAAPPASATASQNAVFYLATQQLSDGTIGTTVAETRDAALAIAGNAQTTSEWNPTEGRNAVVAIQNSGHSPIDAIVADAQSGGFQSGEAVRTIVLTAAPLGWDPTNFAGVNLVAKVQSGANGDGSYGGANIFDDTLYAALALRLSTGSVPATTVACIRGAQQSDGGWNISGVNNGAPSDAEPTGKALMALMALIAGGAVANDQAVRAGVAYPAQTKSSDGSWTNVSVSGNVAGNTAYAVLGLTSAGLDTTNGGWKGPAVSTSPDTYLIGTQQPNGSIPGGSDATSATSQTVQALLRSWLPIAAAGYQVVRANGHLTGLGGAPSNSSTWNGVVGAAATNSGHGTWLGLGNGGVITEGDAGF